MKVSDFDRAAPHGTGHIKAGLNYAMSLYPIVTAHEEGYDENMYLDPATRRIIKFLCNCAHFLHAGRET